MSNATLLTNLRRVYPGDGYRIRFITEEESIPIFLLFRRMESFNDDLSPMRKYRIVSQETHTVIAVRDEEEAIDILLGYGVSEDEMESTLTDMLIEASMVIDLKNEVREQYLDADIISRGVIKKANIESGFDAVKDDPAALAGFIAGLATGGVAKPSLVEVPNDEA